MSMLFMGLCYLIVWISFVGGYWWICQKNENSIKFEKYLWNARIDKMQYPPFSIIMRLSERRNPLILFWVIIINSIMVITEFILGLIFLGPIMLIIQGFMVGALIAQADVKTKIFSLFVLLFELGSFSAASGLGLYAVIQKIFVGIPIIESIATLSSNGYLWIPVILLILNGVFEGSGVIFNICAFRSSRTAKRSMPHSGRGNRLVEIL